MTSLPAISTIGATVGQVFGPISWAQMQPAALLAQQSGLLLRDYFVIQNESQCGFLVTRIGTNRTFRLAAGGWLAPTEATTGTGQDTGLLFTVEYVLANPVVQQIGVDYFAPGEPLPMIRTLGNSPIGGNVSVLNTPTILVAPTTTTTLLNTSPAILPLGTIPSTGLYEVVSSFLVSNSGTATITLQVSYTEGFTGTSVTNRSLSTSAGVSLSGTVLANNGVGVCASTFYCKGGTTINVTFQDSTGTPADQIVIGLNKMF